MSLNTLTTGVVRHAGLTRTFAARHFASSATRSKQRLAVLGSGWGGYELLRRVHKNAYDVTIISPNTYFAFTPLLASTAVGTLEFRCALEPVRRYGDRVASYQAWCDRVDLKNKTLECVPAVGSNVKSRLIHEATPDAPGELAPVSSFPGMKPFNVQYDKLVIAVGAYSQTFNTPGVKEYAHFLKDVKDARRIRSRILECFELSAQPTLTDEQRRALLHFVIVGGGPTGVEFAAELHDLLATDMVRHYPTLAHLARITIYDVAPRILSAFDAGLVEYATNQFARQGVQIKNNRHVVKVNEASIEIKEEGEVPFGMLVWSTGLAPNPLIDSIKELQHDEKTHSLTVTQQFNPHDLEGNVISDVFVIGDAAMLKDKLPATAQVASQEAKWLAKILNAQVRDRADPGDFSFVNQGILTYTGNWTALFDRSGAESGPKPKAAGRFAWLMWRSAYWSQAMSLRNKVALAYHWFSNWIFGRSITRF